MAGGKLISTGVEFPDATTQTTSGLPLTGGTMTGALTTTGFTSTGIDDNATSTAITIDASENVGVGTNVPTQLLHLKGSAPILKIEDATGAAFNVSSLNVSGAETTLSCDADNVISGSYFRTVIDGSERMRINTGGDVTVNTGNLVIGTSGKGIDFSAATPDGTGTVTSEVLDDYETGTWTPAISDGTNSPTMAAQVGKYTKIGNLVTAEGYINVSAVGSATGVIRIAGLPFTNDGAANSFGVCSFGYMNNSSLTSGTTPSGYIAGSSAYAALYVWDSTYTTQLTMAEWGTADAIFEITYRV